MKYVSGFIVAWFVMVEIYDSSDELVNTPGCCTPSLFQGSGITKKSIYLYPILKLCSLLFKKQYVALILQLKAGQWNFDAR